MNRKAFRQLLKRYLDNSCTEEENRIVDQWYELLDSDNISVSDKEMSEIEFRIWNKIHPETSKRNIAIKLNRSWPWYGAVAAIIAVIILISVRGLNHKSLNTESGSLLTAKVKEGFPEIVNISDSVKNIVLEDGSTVSIYPGAKLAFPKHFANNRREVYLEGDAFFTVTKNPNRPFFVYNHQIVTQVLGTSFAIHRKKDGQFEVAVKTGRVAVYENKEQVNLNEVQQKSNGVIITPNQKVTYYQQERHFVTSIVDQPVPVKKESGLRIAESEFNYKEASLQRVLKDLETTYELEIVLENEKVKDCLFTGDLTEENLFNKLQSICIVFNTSYEIKGTKILLKGGNNCK